MKFLWRKDEKYSLTDLIMSCFENFISFIQFLYWGSGIRGLMRGMATLPQGNQELAISGRPPGELGASQWNVTFFLSVLCHCWLGNRKGTWPVKNWVLVCW